MYWAPFFIVFISENFSGYMEGGDESINYAGLDDAIITKEIKEDAVKNKRLLYLSESVVLQNCRKCKYE